MRRVTRTTQLFQWFKWQITCQLNCQEECVYHFQSTELNCAKSSWYQINWRIVCYFQFLVRNKCVWDFNQGIVSFGQKQIRVCHTPAVMHARRVYLAKTTVVPKKTQANLPIRLSYYNQKVLSRDWLIESKIIRDGVIMEVAWLLMQAVQRQPYVL